MTITSPGSSEKEQRVPNAPVEGSSPSPGSTPPLAHYVVVRKDLPLGVLAANVLHAAGESSPGNLRNDTIGVVLAANDEAHLRNLSIRCEFKRLDFVPVLEVDPPYAGQLMAIGIRPTDKATIRRVLSDVPMLR